MALAAKRPFLIEVVTDPAVPLLPPFPAGAAQAETMKDGLDQEGTAGEHARRLLQTYLDQEDGLYGDL